MTMMIAGTSELRTYQPTPPFQIQTQRAKLTTCNNHPLSRHDDPVEPTFQNTLWKVI